MVQIQRWLNQAWDWMVEDIGINLLIGLLAAVFLAFAHVVVAGPVFAGLALAGLRKAKTGRLEVKDFFDGFYFFLPALAAFWIIGALVILGLIFLIVPGLVILGMYQSTFHFMVDERGSFWQAMESSRTMAARDYFGFTILTLILMLVNVLGFLFLGIGVIFTLPFSSLALTAAYVDLTDREAPSVQSAPAP